MIFVPRPNQPPKEVIAALDKPVKASGKSELLTARGYYKQKPAPTKAYAFKRYKEFEVCKWLDQVYKEKCAYCETDYRAVDARDVEHYRPKAGVTEANPRHRGYWWLASHWTNLLPSCPPCNQRRRQFLFHLGMSLEDLERARLAEPKTTSGKANAFPMRPPAKWVVTEKGDLKKEDPLLINPSVRDPSKHIQWVFDWDKNRSELWDADPLLVAVKPVQVDGGDDPYGKASIAVHGLNRSGLVRTRVDRAKVLQRDAAIVVRSLRDAARFNGSPAAIAQVKADRDLLNSRAEAKQPYSAMAKAFIALFDSELKAFLAKNPFQ